MFTLAALCSSQASVFSAGSMHALFSSVLPQWYYHRNQVVEFQTDEVSDPRLRPYCLREDGPKLLPILVGNCESCALVPFAWIFPSMKLNASVHRRRHESSYREAK